MVPFLQTIVSTDTFDCFLQIFRVKDHLRAMIARMDQPADFYYRALQTTLEILDGLPVTY